MTEATNVSEMLDQQSNQGKRNIHTVKQHEDAYQAVHEAGLAGGKEAGYRQFERG